MSLFFTLHATTTPQSAVGLGLVEIKRREPLDLADPAVADAVSTYTVRVDGRERATVRHRYGDGAWPLVRDALVAAFPVAQGSVSAPGAVDELPVEPCDFCEQPIVWTISQKTGTPMPIDAAPTGAGNLLLERRADGRWLAGVASRGVADAARAAGRATYVHHAPSCPHRAEWNKRGPRPAPRRRRGAPA